MLLTRCPTCYTTFRITPELLAAAGGQARCGRCNHVFDAVAGLREQSPSALEPAVENSDPLARTDEFPTGEFVFDGGVAQDDVDPPAEEAPGDEDLLFGSAEEDAVLVAEADELFMEAVDAELAAASPPERDSELDWESGHAGGEAAPNAEPDAAEHDFEAAAEPRGEHADDAPDEPAWDEAPAALEAALDEVAEQADAAVAEPEHAAEHDFEAAAEPRGEHADDAPDEPAWDEAPAALEAALDEVAEQADAAVAEPEHAAEHDFEAAAEPQGEHADDAPEEPVWDEAPAAVAACQGDTPAQTETEAAVLAERREAARPEAHDDTITPEEVHAVLEPEPVDRGERLAESLQSLALEPDEPLQRRVRWWSVGSLVAVLALALQIVNHERSELARSAILGPLLTKTYAAVGIPLVPKWDISQYQIVDWVAAAAPRAHGQSSLKITARIHNRGPRAQPFPKVRLDLTDRWEHKVGSRVFEPREYLASGPSTSLMAAGSTVEAALDVVDPGPDAYGFELDVCIDATDGALVCGTDRVFD